MRWGDVKNDDIITAPQLGGGKWRVMLVYQKMQDFGHHDFSPVKWVVIAEVGALVEDARAYNMEINLSAAMNVNDRSLGEFTVINRQAANEFVR